MIQPAASKNFHLDQQGLNPSTPNLETLTTKQSLKDKLSGKVSLAYHSVVNVLSKPSTQIILIVGVATLALNELIKYKDQSYQTYQKDFNRRLFILLTGILPRSPPFLINPTTLHTRMVGNTDQFLKSQGVSSVSFLSEWEKKSLRQSLRIIIQDWVKEKKTRYTEMYLSQFRDQLLNEFTRNLLIPKADWGALEKKVNSLGSQCDLDNFELTISAKITADELKAKILDNHFSNVHKLF